MTNQQAPPHSAAGQHPTPSLAAISAEENNPNSADLELQISMIAPARRTQHPREAEAVASTTTQAEILQQPECPSIGPNIGIPDQSTTQRCNPGDQAGPNPRPPPTATKTSLIPPNTTGTYFQPPQPARKITPHSIQDVLGFTNRNRPLTSSPLPVLPTTTTDKIPEGTPTTSSGGETQIRATRPNDPPLYVNTRSNHHPLYVNTTTLLIPTPDAAPRPAEGYKDTLLMTTQHQPINLPPTRMTPQRIQPLPTLPAFLNQLPIRPIPQQDRKSVV